MLQRKGEKKRISVRQRNTETNLSQNLDHLRELNGTPTNFSEGPFGGGEKSRMSDGRIQRGKGGKLGGGTVMGKAKRICAQWLAFQPR